MSPSRKNTRPGGSNEAIGGSPIEPRVERGRALEIDDVLGDLVKDHVARSLIHTAISTSAPPTPSRQCRCSPTMSQEKITPISGVRNSVTATRLDGWFAKHEAQQQVGDARPDPEEDHRAERLGGDRVAAQHAAVEHVEEARRDDEDQRTDLRDRGDGKRVDAASDAAHKRRVDRERNHRAEQQDDRQHRRRARVLGEHARCDKSAGEADDERDHRSARRSVADQQHAGDCHTDRFEPDDDRADRRRTAIDTDAHEHGHQADAEHPDHDQLANVASRRRQPATGDDHQHRGGKDESDQVGRGRPEALTGQLVRRQAATEEDDDREQSQSYCQLMAVARDARQPRSTSR